jgi:methionine-rich copper-binding protein CopC
MYVVTVKASDGSLSATQQFNIKVTDLNDNPPVVTMTIRLPENTVEVTPLEGEDDDAGSTVTFSILDKEDGALFRINAGVLEFITAPDFEHPADGNGDNIYAVSVKMAAGDIITILRFQVKIGDVDGAAARTANRSAGSQEEIVVVAVTETRSGIQAYPNPVTGKQFTLRMDSVATGRYSMELYTTAGQLAYRQQVDHTGKSVAYPIQLPSSLTRGMYVLRLKRIKTDFTEKLFIE